MTMNAVVQEERTGCGIASVAALAGVSYAQARDAAAKLGIFAADRTLWSDTAYVRRLLKTYGVRAGNNELPFTSWEELPPCALLAIKWRVRDGKAFWHWVVFEQREGGAVVLDSKNAAGKHTPRFRAHEAQMVHLRLPGQGLR